jgi:hypothetical protein
MCSGGCSEAREARERARAEAVAARSGHPMPPDTSRAVAAAANPLWEVLDPDGVPVGRRFTSVQAAYMFLGRSKGTIRQVR